MSKPDHPENCHLTVKDFFFQKIAKFFYVIATGIVFEKMTIFGNFFEKMATVGQYFASQMAIFRMVRLGEVEASISSLMQTTGR